MTRKTARAIAVRLCFALSESGTGADELIDTVFNEEYYKSLAEEDTDFSEYPDAAQKEYIMEIPTLLVRRPELVDGRNPLRGNLLFTTQA